MGESTLLSPYPNIILVVASNRVDDIVGEPADGDSPVFFSFEPSQTALNRRSPSATARINVYRPRALRLQIGHRVCNKGAVLQSFQASCATKPCISFSIFEERCDWASGFVST